MRGGGPGHVGIRRFLRGGSPFHPDTEHQLPIPFEANDHIAVLDAGVRRVLGVDQHRVPELDVERGYRPAGHMRRRRLERLEDGEHAMHDTLAEMRLPRVLLVHVERIAIGRPLGKPEDVV